MRITFDTNTLDKVTRPERFPKDSARPKLDRLHSALRSGKITGCFSETVVTLEGVQNKDRVEVIGSTRLKSDWSSNQPNIATLRISTQQDRKPLHSENANRVKAALDIGMRALRAPARMGDGFHIKDDGETFFTPAGGLESFYNCMDKVNAAATAIGLRGVGRARALALGTNFNTREGFLTEWWLQRLGRAQNQAEEREVQKAISEWADGDAIASHIGFQIDLFCTHDMGKSNDSILSPAHRQWLETQYGVKFTTLDALFELVESARPL